MHLSQAFGEPGRRTMPRCRGAASAPQARSVPSGCTHQLRAVLLGASNAWFPVTKSALSLPVAHDPLEQLVEKHWTDLAEVTIARRTRCGREVRARAQGLRRTRSRPRVGRSSSSRRQGVIADAGALDLLGPEWALFQNPSQAPLSDDFRLRESPVPARFRGLLERTVLVERLRVVTAMCGFTRIDGPDSGVASDEAAVQCAPLARRAAQVGPGRRGARRGCLHPAVGSARSPSGKARVSGSAAHRGASSQPSALARAPRARSCRRLGWRALRAAALAGARARHRAGARMRLLARVGPGAHLRARAGRTRSRRWPGFLIYTAASDSEGTLGGLVALGETQSLGRLLRRRSSAAACAAPTRCARSTCRTRAKMLCTTPPVTRACSCRRRRASAATDIWIAPLWCERSAPIRSSTSRCEAQTTASWPRCWLRPWLPPGHVKSLIAALRSHRLAAAERAVRRCSAPCRRRHFVSTRQR